MIWNRWLHSIRRALPLLALACLILGILAGLGCASRRQGRAEAQQETGSALEVPRLLSGPLGVLLTNRQDFSARVVLTQSSAKGAPGIRIKGNLFQQEGHILFLPMESNEVGQVTTSAGFRFLWDLRKNGGYVISETLRGYARVQVPELYAMTATAVGVELLEPLRIDDQACRQERIDVRSTQTHRQTFHVWRALDLKDLPIRIVSWPETNRVVLQLSDIQAEALTPELFRIPPTYDQFSSPGAMVRERVRKRHALPYEDTFGTHRPY